jgi:tripartite ATP-independent transporter DctM subunit
MSIGLLSVVLVASVLLLMMVGLPVVFCLGGVATLYTVILWGWGPTVIMGYSTLKQFENTIFIAAPLFVLMGGLLQHSGIADDMFEVISKWLGWLRGGLASGTVLICTAFGAITGVSGTATLTMGLIAIPAMLNRGYHKTIALGCVAAGGLLGIMIPPSLIMILYAMVSGESIGKLFMGGIGPGLLMATLYIIYITVRCTINPGLAPSTPVSERPCFKEKLISLKGVIFPIALILLVLGGIYKGIATPTEAAGVGAVGAGICAALKRRLTWPVLREASEQSFRLTAMVMWLLIGANVFNQLYVAMGAKDLITEAVTGLEYNRWVILMFMQIVVLILGCMMDDFAIVMVCTPIFVPIVKALGFNTFWFALLFLQNIQCAYLTPPYGFNLFYMRAIVPKGITMGDIYRSVWPYIIMQAVVLILIMVFPPLVTWIPDQMIIKK